MKTTPIRVFKASGQAVDFSMDKLRTSLSYSGASSKEIQQILERIENELYSGISTAEIYNRAFSLLKQKKSSYASKYKLKKAIYELGPTGFPFERFIAAILKASDYSAAVGQMVMGRCVDHEVDIIAKKSDTTAYIECKFHNDKGNNCDVKIPLYIHSIYRDIIAAKKNKTTTEGWVVTNTRFTKDAIQYGRCAQLYLLSWDYPAQHGLKDRIDKLGLYPVTVSTLLTQREKDFLLSRDIVLCRQLIGDSFYLDHLGIGSKRKARIINEINMICNGKDS
ncbi:MAG: ATPase [Cytophagaceae bacterium]|nr:ATPase [Cytophagaceae bacterium]